MIQGPDDRRPAMTPQLAVRVTVVGSVALMLFAIIFFRLWFLQVLNSQAYVKQAASNQTRTIDVPAARGEIIDRFGHVLVDSVPTVDVQIDLQSLKPAASPDNIIHPPRPDVVVYRKIATVLGLSMARRKCSFPNPADPKVDVHVRLSFIACQVAIQEMTLPFQNATIAQDVPRDIQFYLAERQDEYPGVEAQVVFRRQYPYHTLAAQLFGTIGRIDKPETLLRRYHGYSPNAVIGQSGLEYEYDKYLRGVDGNEKVSVNAIGQFEGDLPGKKAVQGNTLKLSLDVDLQKVGEAALQQSIGTNPPATGGAFIAMDPRNGQILAMGSNPTFDPTDFTHPMTQAYYNSKYGLNSGDPQFNRAIASAGPDGSTFKPITAIAALESGAWTTSDTYDDPGQFCFPGTTLCLRNAGGAAYGALNLIDAIKVSDDVFFYHLGYLLNADPVQHPNGGALQQWAREFGIGQSPGIDLPNVASGALPSPSYLGVLAKEEKQCENAVGPYKGHPKHPAALGGCGISNAQSQYWTVGDNVNTAVGQGDDQVTPLQLSMVYAALANGGTIVRPHVGMQIDSPDGQVVQNFAPPAQRHLNIDPAYLDAVTTGLREAASAPGGTSADVFSNFGEPVYGKTGTAQHNGQQDYAWYACYVPPSATTRPIVVVVTVEQGGFGAVAAAPVARQILSQWFYGKPGPYVAGKSTTL